MHVGHVVFFVWLQFYFFSRSAFWERSYAPKSRNVLKKVVCLYRTAHRRAEIFEGGGAGGGGGELSSPSSSSNDHQTPQGVGGVAVGAE